MKNPDLFDRNFIHLPEWAQQIAKRKQKERWVRLFIPCKHVMREFFSITVPSHIAFDIWIAYNFPLIERLSGNHSGRRGNLSFSSHILIRP